METKPTYNPNNVGVSDGYGNHAIYSPDGVLMFYTGGRKLAFYVKKGLVDSIGENKYRLKFEPKGLGHGHVGQSGGRIKANPHCLIPRKNICVVSGESDMAMLTKHHIIPSYFRRWLPKTVKYNFQLVVLLKHDLHNEYTTKEHEFYNELGELYGLGPWNKFAKKVTDTDPSQYAKHLAKVLRLHSEKIPAERKVEMLDKIRNIMGVEPTEDFLNQLLEGDMDDKSRLERTIENDFGRALVSKITDIKEFETLWLNHFIEHTQPKYLPEDLVLTYLNNENAGAAFEG